MAELLQIDERGQKIVKAHGGINHIFFNISHGETAIYLLKQP